MHFVDFGEHREALLELVFRVQNQIDNPAFFNWPLAVFADELLHAKVRLAMTEAGPKGVLMAFVCFRESLEGLEITALGTDPDFQRRGVMKSLLLDLKSYAARQNKPIRLEVHEQNRGALTLYKGLSLLEAGKRSRYYKDGSAALLYVWDPSS